MRKLTPALVIGCAILLSGPVLSDEPESKEKEKEVARAYVGTKKCKMCHSKEAKGDQFAKWKAGPHSGAFATLATEESKKVAVEAGVEGNPQEAAECLSCHVTGAGAAAELTEKLDPANGVSCESCHGAGADYHKMKVMKSIFTGETTFESVGLLDPNEELCVTCHNENSPTYKPFDFEKKSAMIDHSYPAEVEAKRKAGK